MKRAAGDGSTNRMRSGRTFRKRQPNPQGMGSADAGRGLPIAPLLVNADEVIGTGTPISPNGTVQHPIRFTLNHMLNYWVWPATETAGVGSCTATGGSSIAVESLISQSSPPASCTWSAPAGEIYRLMASVPNPTCASTSPQSAIIITAMRNYGIILADNGCQRRPHRYARHALERYRSSVP